jgi:ribosomal protein S18 acetylase RimI-like enzyme
MSTTEETLPANEVIVRPAITADRDRVLELVGELGHAFPLDADRFSEAFTFALADEGRTAIFVAEADGNVVGYCLVTMSPLLYSNGLSAQLQEIATDQDTRATGVGTALVRAVEALCEQMGVTQLTVASRRAGGFYDRLGYHEAAEYMRRLF